MLGIPIAKIPFNMQLKKNTKKKTKKLNELSLLKKKFTIVSL